MGDGTRNQKPEATPGERVAVLNLMRKIGAGRFAALAAEACDALAQENSHVPQLAGQWVAAAEAFKLHAEE